MGNIEEHCIKDPKNVRLERLQLYDLKTKEEKTCRLDFTWTPDSYEISSIRCSCKNPFSQACLAKSLIPGKLKKSIKGASTSSPITCLPLEKAFTTVHTAQSVLWFFNFHKLVLLNP